MAQSVSCVICAYNEAERIGDVLRVVAGHPEVSEVIVVDDGSSDGTSDIVRSIPGVRLIVNEHNIGKSATLVRGVELASGELILMLDADLQHLTRENISALLKPVLSGEADMSMSLRGNSLFLYRTIGIDFVSGERVFPRSLITKYAETIKHLTSFGVESFMNEKIIAEKMRIAIVSLPNVINSRKRDKMGWWQGTKREFKMIGDILRVISPLEVLRQNYAMLRLSRKGRRSRAKLSAEFSHE